MAKCLHVPWPPCHWRPLMKLPRDRDSRKRFACSSLHAASRYGVLCLVMFGGIASLVIGVRANAQSVPARDDVLAPERSRSVPETVPGRRSDDGGRGAEGRGVVAGLRTRRQNPDGGGLFAAKDGAARAFGVSGAPSPPTEFQRFVESATGRLLPAFGADFFTSGQLAGMDALDGIPVSADYTVGAGDEVIVRAWGSIDLDFKAQVDRNGQLHLPKVGSFNVAGVKAADLESHLRGQIGRLYNNFRLSVTPGQLRGVKVYVVGPAKQPGVYTLPGQATLLSAVVAAGGPGPNGSLRKVLLRRGGRVMSELDVYEFLVSGDSRKDMQLIAGDVIVFEPAGPRVALLGAIDSPAVYELKTTEEALGEVLRYAGGAAVTANPNLVQLERISASRAIAPRSTARSTLDRAGLQQLLRDGDVVSLLPITPEFANAVTLRGPVAQPLRYAFQPGMRILDLIPDLAALVSPGFHRRTNRLVQVDSDGRALDEPARQEGDQSDRQPAASEQQPGPTDPASIAPRGGQRQADSRRLAGSVRVKPIPTPLFDDLNWDYATIERLDRNTLTTQLIPFNLGAVVLRHDASNNIVLFAGDVVTVFAQKEVRGPTATQTRLVTLEGEVAAAGVYQLQAGETLRGLVARAGGLTPQAYVYGIEFSREKARERQRENLAEAIARFESLAATQTARDAANRRDDTAAAAAATVSNTATQAQLSRLNHLQPNGRIALELGAQDTGLASLPDVHSSTPTASSSRPGRAS